MKKLAGAYDIQSKTEDPVEFGLLVAEKAKELWLAFELLPHSKKSECKSRSSQC